MWDSDKKLDIILEYPNPPSLAALKSLPEFTYGDEHGFAVHLFYNTLKAQTIAFDLLVEFNEKFAPKRLQKASKWQRRGGTTAQAATKMPVKTAKTEPHHESTLTKPIDCWRKGVRKPDVARLRLRQFHHQCTPSSIKSMTRSDLLSASNKEADFDIAAKEALW
ncbi:hypothetical protein NEUTE1DRAFT_135951 [Neurospora tetrasperma FGSC 2508]|uniref:Uncharacterized protein n=1 Tax=Neurospora tetrasperma (strain FGSC 2508 / ATCC MYA-4615 / P0657) TaxID=510951 RepID=F8MHU9_NEUT8|nr:uncharacterized protein NEUTE1DRAFT_135951 [Neurospora tetrasperma FGSC 2508]EGO58858.1 hypothetical protein NEUTE1DRAFT_135951 [Neurospora tetrasperma FGSC 2508]EGZ72958.1 hypothetical protein NEUTE2DRAFT_165141 [Neurospora tetrasperma FGSC 2509]